MLVSVLFSEPKIPQFYTLTLAVCAAPVSVLFSEPKIPQSNCKRKRVVALARFQCSSASRKFLNRYDLTQRYVSRERFSALQRAENSSIKPAKSLNERKNWFQCSSASRKFLNVTATSQATTVCAFQCSSASRKFLNFRMCRVLLLRASVSVLFSEPKIPQFD